MYGSLFILLVVTIPILFLIPRALNRSINDGARVWSTCKDLIHEVVVVGRMGPALACPLHAFRVESKLSGLRTADERLRSPSRVPQASFSGADLPWTRIRFP